MKKGRFEAPKTPSKRLLKRTQEAESTGGTPIPAEAPAPEQAPIREKAQTTVPADPQPQGRKRRRRDWLLIVVPVLVVAALAAILVVSGVFGSIEDNAVGLTKDETLDAYRRMAEALENHDMVLTLRPEPAGEGDIPLQLTLSPSVSRVKVDLVGLEADLKEGVGRVGFRRYVMDPQRYISVDRGVLRQLATETEEKYARPFMESFYVVSTRQTGDEEQKVLTVNIGRREQAIDADAIYEAFLNAYLQGDLSPELSYSARSPQELDVDQIWDEVCTKPVDAHLVASTYRIIPEMNGFGFEKKTLNRILESAVPGKGYVLALGALRPKVTTADVEAKLYADVLGEAHTPHSWVDDRTVNLMLACEQLDGTVIMPGKTFSFNQTVGERTEEKGYREATAYVGGASVPEIGGGVCQVASTIYYAVLQADLQTVERHAHTYLVTYVPEGMDAAIYWGTLDYKFRNNSPYPIRIDASVSDGKVHIILRGKEWKNYTVHLSSKVLKEIPWETKERYVGDGSYEPGDVIVSPYTGYEIETYRTIKDFNGKVIESNRIAYSTYRKRDKVIAVNYRPQSTEPPPEVAEPSDDD